MQAAVKYMVKIGLIVLTLSCSNNNQKILVLPYTAHADIVIDGQLQDWETHTSLFQVRDFISPWDTTSFGSTKFNAIRDSTWLYFYFDIIDSQVVSAPFIKETDVALGDRVEIFFAGDTTLNDYYCIEIGPYGDVLDYQASYYRQFDDTWNLSNLEVAGHLTEKGYIVEGRIPISFLSHISKNETSKELKLWMGLYRAEFSEKDIGEKTVQWISWINPDTSTPDFHVPSSFQLIKIEKPL